MNMREGKEGGRPAQRDSAGKLVITDRLQEFAWIQPEHVWVFKTKWENKINPSGVLF